MYEILVGRTPFEEHEQEDFADQERAEEYQRRATRGRWWGEYSIPSGELPYHLKGLTPSVLRPAPRHDLPRPNTPHHG